MRIPHTALAAETLRAIVEEFTTRDGTDHSPIGPRIDAVLSQLESRIVELHFDDDTKSCNIVPVSGSVSRDGGLLPGGIDDKPQ